MSDTPRTAPPGRLASANGALAVGIVASFAVTLSIWGVGGRLDAQPLLPDAGAAWYYWKLPDPTWVTRLSAWLP